MRAMLVAAGYGTRLSPLTDELPKPAVPVANQPAAWFALDHLARAGVRDFAVNTHHLAGALRAALEPLAPPGVALRFVHEPEILGTGGGVRNAWQPADGEDFVVMNGKLLYGPDLERALSLHRESGAVATMLVRALPADAGFAPVEVDAEGRVRRLRGLPEAAADPGLTARMYTGVQILSARAHRDLPQAGDIIEHAYLPWLERGETVMGVLDEGGAVGWRDVGVTPTHYLDANLAMLRGEVPWPGIEVGQDATIVADAAHVAGGARVSEAVVGAGATVPADTVLRRSVVWPDAHVPSGVVEDAIVTTAGVVLRPRAADGQR